MTENEAIAKMKYRIKTVTNMAGKGADGKAYEDMEMAIEALEEIQQYRAIGTVEECQAAMEKQREKVSTYEGDGYSDGEFVYDTWICPNCGEHYEVDFDDYEYCPNCGQHLDRL